MKETSDYLEHLFLRLLKKTSQTWCSTDKEAELLAEECRYVIEKDDSIRKEMIRHGMIDTPAAHGSGREEG